MIKFRILYMAGLTSLLLSGCASQSNEDTTVKYDESKKMVIDIMKSDEGKKAIQDLLASEDVKNHLIMDDQTVKTTIEDSLTSEKAKKFWNKAFQDPEFAAAYAKGLKQEHKQLMTDLMKDADYRSLLVEVLADKEMEKEITKLLKSTEIRKVIKEEIIETVDSPLVKAKLQEILMKAAEEDLSSGSGKDKGDGSSQTDTSGSGGGSGGGSQGQGGQGSSGG